MYRHYCKHKNWIGRLISGHPLPYGVTLVKELEEDEVDSLMKEVVFA